MQRVRAAIVNLVRAAELKKVSRMRDWAATGKARQMRTDADVTLREVAEVVQTSASSLSRWETGQSRPRPQSALRWARFLAELTGETL